MTQEEVKKLVEDWMLGREVDTKPKIVEQGAGFLIVEIEEVLWKVKVSQAEDESWKISVSKNKDA